MADNLQIGDTVKLKSGGPLMTIESIDKYADGIVKARCVWIDEKTNKASGEVFALVTLVKE
jgi:uncharacterized protein YodC (DUF2158 family)